MQEYWEVFCTGDHIQFVATTENPWYGNVGIYHGFVHDFQDNPSITGTILGDGSLDLGYPNISFTGSSEEDIEAIISCNHSSDVEFPGFSSIYATNKGTYSPTTIIKYGTDFIDIIQGSYERWGDYTGSQMAYEDPGSVWVSGSFGKRRNNFPRRVSETWIAKIASPDSIAPGTPVATEVKIFPNPAVSMVYMEFVLSTTMHIDVDIFDTRGSIVKKLVSDKAKPGLNQVTFHSSLLPAGVYVLTVTSGELQIASEKIVIQ